MKTFATHHKMKIPFRIVLLFLLFLSSMTTSSGRQMIGGSGSIASDWVHAGKDGKLIYKSTARGDKIIDFSHAGYMGGGVALPDPPVVRTVKPSGSNDDTGLIQKAIDEAAALPLKNGFHGTVLLSPGRFTCAGPIYLHTSGVVLRGSGAVGTTIAMAGGKHL